MRRSLPALLSTAAVAAGFVAGVAFAGPASAAAPTVTTQPVASGASAYPDVPALLAANPNWLVYANYDAANAPHLSALPMSGGASAGDAVAVTGFQRATSNGLVVDSNLSIAGDSLAGDNGLRTGFGNTQDWMDYHDLSDPTATTRSFALASAQVGFNYVPVEWFVSAAPHGFVTAKLITGTNGAPDTIHLLYYQPTATDRGTPTDIGTLPNADTTNFTVVAGAPVGTTAVLVGYSTTTANTDDLVQAPLTGQPTLLVSSNAYNFSSLSVGGGYAAWANYFTSFSDPSAHAYTIPLDGSGNGTARQYSVPLGYTLDGITEDNLVLSSGVLNAGTNMDSGADCPATVHGCAYNPFATVDTFSGTLSKSTTVDSSSATSDGTNIYLTKGLTLGTAGIYSATSATSAETLVLASPAKPLWAAEVAASPGRVTWADDSTATGPVLTRPVSAGPTLGAVSTVTGSSIEYSQAGGGYGMAASGARTAYTVPTATAGTDALKLVQPDGTVTQVATFSDGTPYLTYQDPVVPTMQVSGSRVLYLQNDPDNAVTSFDAKLYDATTGTTTNLPQESAYALSGGYLAWLAIDGSVWRKDLVAGTAPVQLRAPVTVPSGDQLDESGQVAIAGDYVSWLAKDCLEPSGGYSCVAGTEEVGFRNAATMAAATVVKSLTLPISTSGTPNTLVAIAQSADYLVYDQNNASGTAGFNQLTAVSLAAPATTVTLASSSNYVSGTGKFAVDGSNVAWISSTGAPQISQLGDGTPDSPRVLTTSSTPVTEGGTNGTIEVVASAPIASCTVIVYDPSSTEVDRPACSAAPNGDVVVSWDGKDAGGNFLTPGTYTWTITASNATGGLQAYDGSDAAISGTIKVTSTTPVPQILSVSPQQTAVTVGVRVPATGTAASTVTVTASPGGATASADVNAAGDAFPTVTGLTSGTSYTFTVTASGSGGLSSPSPASAAVTPNATVGTGDLVPVGPVRSYDTRKTGGSLTAGETRSIPVSGVAGVPSTGVAAVALAVSVINPSNAGYVTVWPSGVARPRATTVNFNAGQTKTDLTKVPVGSDGTVSIYNFTGTTGFTFDVVGYYEDGSGTYNHDVSFAAVAPVRVLDTRTSNGGAGALPAGGSISAPVRGGATGVPDTATAVEINVEAVDPSAAGYLTVWADGATRPVVSNVLYGTHQTIDTSAMAQIGTDGKITVFANTSTDVVVDVVGYYDSAADGRFVAITPVREFDTRAVSSPLTQGETREVPLAGLEVNGSTPVPADATGVVFSATSVNNTQASYLTVWPHGQTRPHAANLLPNQPNTLTDNLVVSGLGGGAVDVYNNTGSTDFVVDVNGYYISAANLS